MALLGPRQCGKTTLARMIAAERESLYLDLEKPADRRRLESPMQMLEGRSGLVVLDEIQRLPKLFEILKILADDPQTPARFLILGSASPDLVRGVSESLAGRVTFVDLGGFGVDEVGLDAVSELWLRGGFPRSFLAADADASLGWRRDFTRTFLERDIPALGLSIPAETLRRFWMMLAHLHAELWIVSAAGTPTSGRPTRVPSSTSWYFTEGAASASRSSSRTLPGSPGRCVLPTTTSSSIRCGSSTLAKSPGPWRMVSRPWPLLTC